VLGWIEDFVGDDLPRPSCNHAPIASALPLVLERGWGDTLVTVADDDSLAFTLEVLASPHGVAEIAEDGTLTYRADRTFAGEDEVAVQVRDDGSLLWPDSSGATSRLVIPVVGRHGCESASAPWLLALWIAPFVRRRCTISAR
jgi:hypothetical protein